MSYINPIWLEGQRQRWQRHDWQRFMRHDPHRFLTPAGIAEQKRAAQAEADAALAAEQKAFEEELWQVRRDLAALKGALAARRAARLREAEAPRHKSDFAWERFIETFKRYVEQQKAGFNPDQPRDDHGKWTDSDQATEDLRTSADAQQEPRIQLAGDVTGFTKHGINQAITRGVSPSTLHDAVTNPIQILPQSNGTTQYVGRGAVVVLNPLGQVVTTWRR